MNKYIKNCTLARCQCPEGKANMFSLEHFEKIIEEKHTNFNNLSVKEKDYIFKQELSNFREVNKCPENCYHAVNIFNKNVETLLKR
ncbi:MAG: hypothetical protein PHG82_05390 [Candidatus Gracilibacteria bacterium]|nr:hypothetical protein [Candidatus Gracilibacteria bacterium]